MPVTVETLSVGARTVLRDYPQYFEVDEGPLNVLTVRLPHPLISTDTLQVYLTPLPTQAVPNPPSVLSTDWQLDARNGLLKLNNVADLNKRAVIAGFYFTWFTDEDLAFHMTKAVNEVTYNGTDLDCQPDVVSDVIMLGGVIQALWSLAMELMLDIDVSTPEGMFIPARQRYQQVLQMLQSYEAQYNTKAAMLNIGLGALEITRLRRVALMTGRYVPVYRDREFDDPRPPERLYPQIPYGVPPQPECEDDILEISTW